MGQITIIPDEHIQDGFLFTDTPPDRSVLDEAARAKLRVFRIALEGVTAKLDLIDRLKRGLSMPDYVGHNWDAVEEAMLDLDAGQSAGFLTIILNANSLLTLPQRDVKTFISVLHRAQSIWQKDGKQFVVAFVEGERLREFLLQA